MGWLRAMQQAFGVESKEMRRARAIRLRSELVELYRESRFAEAARVAQELLDWQRAEIGEAHPDFALGLVNLARVVRKEGNRPHAIRVAERAIELRHSTLGADHPDTLAAVALVEEWRAQDRANPVAEHKPQSPIFRPTNATRTAQAYATQKAGLSLAIAELSESEYESESEASEEPY